MNHFLQTKTPNTDEAISTTSRTRNHFDIERPAQAKARQPHGLAAALLRRVLKKCGDPPLRFILPDGQENIPGGVEPVGDIAIGDYRTFWSMALDPLFQFGEAYANGRLEVRGDMAECLTPLYRAMNRSGNLRTVGERIFSRLRRPNSNSLRSSKDNIHHHYDIGNDFYRLWLDDKMLYTCAYFERRDDSLEQAQSAKMSHVCRKLRLQPGMTVVEAGCGWGALAIHMAQHCGVNVKAFNISGEQIDWARDRAKKEGLNRKVEFIKDDWRNICGQFDAFASVGMLEHVGVKNYRQLGEKIFHCLKPDGVGLIHTIGQNYPAPFSPWIERMIFPGAYTPSLAEMMQVFESNGLSVLDVENLRLHYSQTLRHWLDRFEDSVEQVRDQFGERFVRMWRLYLAGSLSAFESGYLQLFQVVFAKSLSNNIPRTRSYLYDSPSRRISRVVRHAPANGSTTATQGWNQL